MTSECSLEWSREWLTRQINALGAAIAIALAFSANPVAAADLGDSCCADLEERIAELEATTARKGNRKVSLAITGYVTKQIMFWDDGVERNAYIADVGPTQATNFRFTGEATIAPGWKAGYMMRIQDLPTIPWAPASSLTAPIWASTCRWRTGTSRQRARQAQRRQERARGKEAAMFTDLSGTQVIANYVLFDGGGFFLRQDGNLTALKWGDFGYCYAQQRPWGGDCDGIVMNGVRYDSPVFAGFSVSASWGEDDDWEVATRYAGEAAGFKLAFGAGYSVNTDEQTQPPPVSQSKTLQSSKRAVMRSISPPDCSSRGLWRGRQQRQEDLCRLHRAQLAPVVCEGRRAAAVVATRSHRHLWRIRRLH